MQDELSAVQSAHLMILAQPLRVQLRLEQQRPPAQAR